MTGHTKLRAIDGGAITPDEVALLKAYRSMNSVGRNDVLCIVKAFVGPYARQQPVLKLVQGGGHNAKS